MEDRLEKTENGMGNTCAHTERSRLLSVFLSPIDRTVQTREFDGAFSGAMVYYVAVQHLGYRKMDTILTIVAATMFLMVVIWGRTVRTESDDQKTDGYIGH